MPKAQKSSEEMKETPAPNGEHADDEESLPEELKYYYMKEKLYPDNMANWRRNLTGSQRQMLARAWDKNGTPPHQAGWKVYIKIFETRPDVLLQFGVQAKSPEQLSYVDSFVAHTQVFGEMLEFVMKRLPNDRSMSNVVVPYLRELGARHCTRMRKGFRDTYWDVMANAMSECFAEWDKVTKEKTRTRAWRTFVYLMVEEVRIGYDIATKGGAEPALIKSSAFFKEIADKAADEALAVSQRIRQGIFDPLAPVEMQKAKQRESERKNSGGSQPYMTADEKSEHSSYTSAKTSKEMDAYSVWRQSHSQLLHQLNTLQTVNGASELNGEPSKLEAQYAAHMQAVSPLPNINGSTQVTAASTSAYYDGQLSRRRFLPPRQNSDASSRELPSNNNSDSGWSSQSRNASLTQALYNGHINRFVPPLLNGTRRQPPPYALVRRATSHTRVQSNDIDEQVASLSRRSGSVSSKEETVYSTLV